MPDDRLMTLKEVGALLGSERFARRLIEERRISYVKLGALVRIRESVLNTYLEENTVRPVSRVRRMRRCA